MYQQKNSSTRYYYWRVDHMQKATISTTYTRAEPTHTVKRRNNRHHMQPTGTSSHWISGTIQQIYTVILNIKETDHALATGRFSFFLVLTDHETSDAL